MGVIVDLESGGFQGVADLSGLLGQWAELIMGEGGLLRCSFPLRASRPRPALVTWWTWASATRLQAVPCATWTGVRDLS